ncbi:MAG: rod-binding protein [Parvularculaceae bacterium]|nr:rod-binding protein [Parvularculaceae bacterium]
MDVAALASTPRPAATAPAAADPHDAKIRKAAKDFEATFIAQMLTYAGFGKSVSADAGFGGEAFSSLLIEQYARQVADRGGFGLAESIYQQLKAQEQGHDSRA